MNGTKPYSEALLKRSRDMENLERSLAAPIPLVGRQHLSCAAAWCGSSYAAEACAAGQSTRRHEKPRSHLSLPIEQFDWCVEWGDVSLKSMRGVRGTLFWAPK